MGKSILIVEDEPQLLQVLKTKFERNNFSVHTGKNGLVGLRLAKKYKPDIILLDLLMPKMRGLDMLERVRSFNVWGAHVPVIILTNVSPDEGVLKQITKTEPAYYLVKSDVRLDEVYDKVKEILNGTTL